MLVDEDVIVEAENTETKRSNGFGRNSEIAIPPKRAQSPPKITKSRHSRKSYVLQDFRKLGMGIEIIVKGVF